VDTVDEPEPIRTAVVSELEPRRVLVTNSRACRPEGAIGTCDRSGHVSAIGPNDHLVPGYLGVVARTSGVAASAARNSPGRHPLPRLVDRGRRRAHHRAVRVVYGSTTRAA
jgi:hypothetical protein